MTQTDIDRLIEGAYYKYKVSYLDMAPNEYCYGIFSKHHSLANQSDMDYIGFSMLAIDKNTSIPKQMVWCNSVVSESIQPLSKEEIELLHLSIV